MPRQYRHRRSSNPANAFPSPLEPGEIAVNTANRQLALGDANATSLGVPLPLLAVRFFDIRAQYVLNDYVIQAGVLYRANGSIPPGAFNASNWSSMTGSPPGTFVLRVGDTMSGDLILAKDTPSLRLTNNVASDFSHYPWIEARQNALTTWSISMGAGPLSDWFTLDRYDNTGNNIDAPLMINRADGLVLLDKDPTSGMGVATKQYVDGKSAYTPSGGIAAATIPLAIAELDSEKVAKAGDTMTGNLAVRSTTGSSYLHLNPVVAAQQAFAQFYQTDVLKWIVGKQTDNSFIIHDVATPRTVMQVFAGSATVFFNSSVTLPANPTNPLEAATKQYVDAASGMTTGDAKLTFKTVADTGWIMANDGSIGNVASNATTRNNADTVTLFTLLYNNIPALIVQDSTGATVGRGASAAADYAANRRLVIPKALGRSIAIAGAGAGLTSRVLGSNGGAETETPTLAKTAAHNHTFVVGNAGVASYQPAFSDGTASGPAVVSGSGSGAALSIVDPSVYLNCMIKL